MTERAMELIPNGVCIICNENTSVLSRSAIEPYVTQVENAFFDVDKNNLLQFQEHLQNKNFCALCAEKIVIANLFKNAYEDITKKRITFQKTFERCFFCEGESGDLLKVNDNPNDFVTKIATFMKNTPYPSSCDGCVTCFECFLHANIWFEVFDKVKRKKRSNCKDMTLSDYKSRSSASLDNSGLEKDKENVTPPHNNIQTTKRKSGRNVAKRSKQKSNSNKKMFNELDAVKRSKNFQEILKTQLSKFKNLREQQQTEINFPSSITSDLKMYSHIPYVLMLRQELQETYRATRKSSKENAMEVIVLSDSDENSGVKQAPKLLIRRPIKISLSKNFTLDTKKKPKRVKQTCHVCDKEFYNYCKYKSHILWHEKPEHFQINLVRCTFPSKVDASDFPSKMASTNESSVGETENRNLEINSIASVERDENCDTSKESEENPSVIEINNSQGNKKSSITENGIAPDTPVQVTTSSDSESNASENEGLHEKRSADNRADVSNDLDRNSVVGSKDSSDGAINEVGSNGIQSNEESHSESVSNLAEPQAHSTMFDIDDNAADSQNVISDLQNKSDDDASGDNENGEVSNYANVGKKRKWNDLNTSIDQNSGDEATPKRKKVRFALDYANSADTIVEGEEKLNNSDGLSEHDDAVVHEA